MSHQLLLPHRFKRLGWLILVPATLMGIILLSTDFEAMPLNTNVFVLVNDENLGKFQYLQISHANITPTLAGILFIAGTLFVGFSKEKNEDEFIASLRRSSLLWAVLVNGLLLLFSFAFIYGSMFLNVMLYNMFTVPVIYIARFNYVLYRNSLALPDEKYN